MVSILIFIAIMSFFYYYSGNFGNELIESRASRASFLFLFGRYFTLSGFPENSNESPKTSFLYLLFACIRFHRNPKIPNKTKRQRGERGRTPSQGGDVGVWRWREGRAREHGEARRLAGTLVADWGSGKLWNFTFTFLAG